MSPSRTRKPVARLRSRQEIVVAVVIGVAIVGGTALLIWLMRPGEAGVEGSGGLLSRQSRVTLLLVVTLSLIALVVWNLVRGRHRPRKMSTGVAVGGSVVIIVILAVVAGVLWPGGLIHHYQSLTVVPDNPIPTPTTQPAAPTTAPTGTTAPRSTAPGSTAPGTTAPAGTATPTSRG